MVSKVLPYGQLYNLKGYSTPPKKKKICLHLLTLKLFQTCMNLLLLLNNSNKKYCV